MGRPSAASFGVFAATRCDILFAALFFNANIGAGLPAARSAFLTELLFRATTAGFYGALTQAFRDIRPVWTGTLTGMLVLPVTTHALEFIVHYSLGSDLPAVPGLFAGFMRSLIRGIFRFA